MEKLTQDGGIVKCILKPAVDSKATPKWVKGTNALLHYKVSIAPFRPLHSQPHHCSNESNTCSSAIHHKHPISLAKQHFVSPNGTQFLFDPSAKKLIVDSKERDGPDNFFELRMGKSFVFKALEQAVQSMKVGERSRFLVAPEYTEGFVQLEILLRREVDREKGKNKDLPYISSCCGGMPSTTHSDLYETENLPLELEVYLHQVQYPNEFKREVWEMSVSEKCQELPITKNKADGYCIKHDYSEARINYRRCLVLLENLRMLQATGDETWKECPLTQEEINQQTLNCQLNDTLCSLKLQDYAQTISQCSEILKKHPRQPKALYRRAMAYIRIGRDLEEAEADLKTLIAEGAMRKDDEPFKSIWNELKERFASVTKKEKRMFKNILSAY